MYRSVYFRSMLGGYHNFCQIPRRRSESGSPSYFFSDTAVKGMPSLTTLSRQTRHGYIYMIQKQSAVWRRSGSPPPEKVCVSKLAGKQMYIMFCDRRGMIMCHAVLTKCTVNADYYSKVFLLSRNYFIDTDFKTND